MNSFMTIFKTLLNFIKKIINQFDFAISLFDQFGRCRDNVKNLLNL